MDRTERFYRIERLLGEHRVVPLVDLIHDLGVSRATVIRDLTYLRDRLQAPIVFDRIARGYRLDPKGSRRHALPGLWFNASEIRSFLALQQLIQQIEPGLLAGQGDALERRLVSLLGAGATVPASISDRIRLIPYRKPRAAGRFFDVAVSAAIERRRMQVDYENRHSGEVLRRTISPQRLVYHRDNWYLDAWCHLREAVRIFAVDALKGASELPDAAVDLPPELIAERLDPVYGVFSSPSRPRRWAQLKFSPYRARWVAVECWHPDQRSRVLETGDLLLELPYQDSAVLVRDILREGRHCEVLAPEELRREVADEVGALGALYTR